MKKKLSSTKCAVNLSHTNTNRSENLSEKKKNVIILLNVDLKTVLVVLFSHLLYCFHRYCIVAACLYRGGATKTTDFHSLYLTITFHARRHRHYHLLPPPLTMPPIVVAA